MLLNAPALIPRSRRSEPDELEQHLTLWVRSGTAHVRVGEEHHRLDAGTGICLPPGTDHDVWTEPGTITLPICSPERLLPGSGGVEPVAERFQESLIERYSRDAWAELPGLDGCWPSRSSPDPGSWSHPGGSPVGELPPLPRTGPAARVAAALVDDPMLDRGLEEWARWAACSASTLRRGFLAQTGVSFSQWRQLARLARAAERLAAGRSVGETAAEVGFDSRWGFSGAFRAHYGVTPRDFTRQAGARAAPAPVVDERAGVVRQPLPRNVMLWLRDGELHATFGGRTCIARAGEVVWLPAGSTIESAPRSSLPLSILCSDCVQLSRPRRVRFSRAWNDWLLWASISTNSLLRAEEHHGRRPERNRSLHTHVLDAFAAQLAVERARGVPMPEDTRARAAATTFLQALGTSTECSTHDVEPDVHRAFRAETGMTYASWRHAARMRLARQLLQDGTASSRVAVRVGFTRLSNFSRAFSRFHGIGPREFQELEGPPAGLEVG